MSSADNTDVSPVIDSSFSTSKEERTEDALLEDRDVSLEKFKFPPITLFIDPIEAFAEPAVFSL